jgi:hypothetical protein
MPIIPLRKLGSLGVIADTCAYNIPPEAVSRARNVRFADGRISKAHTWRSFVDGTTGSTPIFMYTITNPGGFDTMGYVTRGGDIYHVASGAETNVSIAAYTPANSDEARTFCSLQGVQYVNQADRVPWAFTPGATDFVALANWTSTHKCQSLRSFKDYLIALNIDKNGTLYPNMVKWSNIAQYGSVPDSWDPADTTKSAGENTLSEIKTEILDGMTLRNSFVIYATDQVHQMEYTAGPDVFQVFKVTSDRGILNTNCVTEVDGIHYVFDDDDIYGYDGAGNPRSICDQRVRNYIFRNIDLLKKNKAFVYHNEATHEIWFCHNSKSDDCFYTGNDCTYNNCAAVYNYTDNTWTFYDLPNVSSMSASTLDESTTWSATTLTWDNAGGSWSDQEGRKIRSTFATSVIDTDIGITASRILNADDDVHVSLSLPAEDEAAPLVYVERTGMDMDDYGEEIRAYKMFRGIYPQVRCKGSATVNFKFGGTTYLNEEVTWEAMQEFNPQTDYKCDTRANGRYLSWYAEAVDDNAFFLSGYDLDVIAPSRR